MAINYPSSIDNGTSIPVPTGLNTQNNPDHASLHSLKQAAIIALESKVGTGASTPVANTFLFGTGTGTSAWTQATSAQVAAAVTDETGTGSLVFATTPTLVTPKVDTINEATGGNGVTIAGLNIKSGALTTANSTPVGSVIQIVATNYGAVATGSTVIPIDDTIPQITEGTEFMTQAITPKSATNRLFIEAEFMLSLSINSQIAGALFQDSTANALAAKRTYNGNFVNNPFMLRVTHDMVAGTTSSTTFRLRAGGESAGTWTFNGVSGARTFGGVTLSTIKVTEYKA